MAMLEIKDLHVHYGVIEALVALLKSRVEKSTF